MKPLYLIAIFILLIFTKSQSQEIKSPSFYKGTTVIVSGSAQGITVAADSKTARVSTGFATQKTVTFLKDCKVGHIQQFFVAGTDVLSVEVPLFGGGLTRIDFIKIVSAFDIAEEDSFDSKVKQVVSKLDSYIDRYVVEPFAYDIDRMFASKPFLTLIFSAFENSKPRIAYVEFFLTTPSTTSLASLTQTLNNSLHSNYGLTFPLTGAKDDEALYSLPNLTTTGLTIDHVSNGLNISQLSTTSALYKPSENVISGLMLSDLASQNTSTIDFTSIIGRSKLEATAFSQNVYSLTSTPFQTLQEPTAGLPGLLISTPKSNNNLFQAINTQKEPIYLPTTGNLFQTDQNSIFRLRGLVDSTPKSDNGLGLIINAEIQSLYPVTNTRFTIDQNLTTSGIAGLNPIPVSDNGLLQLTHSFGQITTPTSEGSLITDGLFKYSTEIQFPQTCGTIDLSNLIDKKDSSLYNNHGMIPVNGVNLTNKALYKFSANSQQGHLTQLKIAFGYGHRTEFHIINSFPYSHVFGQKEGIQKEFNTSDHSAEIPLPNIIHLMNVEVDDSVWVGPPIEIVLISPRIKPDGYRWLQNDLECK